MPQIAYKPGENRQNNQKYLKMKFSILLSADLDLKGKKRLGMHLKKQLLSFQRN